MSKTILEYTSYWALSDNDRNTVKECVLLPTSDLSGWDHRSIYNQKNSLKVAHAAATRRLQGVSSVLFKYMPSAKKKALHGELRLIFFVLLQQFKLDGVERNLSDYEAGKTNLEYCYQLLQKLEADAYCAKDPLAQENINHQPSNAGRYIGLKLILPEYIEVAKAVSTKRFKTLEDFLSYINERRLYWVWGGATIRTFLECFPEWFSNTGTANTVMTFIAPITGCMSWILYFTRAGIEWAGLVSHTFEFAMGEEERNLNVPWQERFTTQWQMRKYALLNDCIWGLCNLACYMVLVGPGLFGYLGNVATAVLLLMDVTLTVLRMEEEQTAMRASRKRYTDGIEALKVKIATLEHKKGNADVTLGDAIEQEIQIQKEALLELYKLLKKVDLDNKYAKLDLSVDLMYAISLLVAFSILCCFFFPPTALAPLAMMTLALVGVTLCFALNVIYTGVKMSFQVDKSQEMHDMTLSHLQQHASTFLEAVQNANKAKYVSDSFEKKNSEDTLRDLYLVLMGLQAQSHHEQRLIEHQRLRLYTSVVRDILIPPLFIAALVFMPLGIGIPILVVGVLLAMGIHFALKSDPVLQEIPDFDESNFQLLREKVGACQEPNAVLQLLDHMKSLHAKHPDSFFTSTKPAEDNQPLLSPTLNEEFRG